jgi:hypothetical protein
LQELAGEVELRAVAAVVVLTWPLGLDPARSRHVDFECFGCELAVVELEHPQTSRLWRRLESNEMLGAQSEEFIKNFR